MKKILSLAIATVFAFAATAQTAPAAKSQGEQKKVDKVAPSKMDDAAKKEAMVAHHDQHEKAKLEHVKKVEASKATHPTKVTTSEKKEVKSMPAAK